MEKKVKGEKGEGGGELKILPAPSHFARAVFRAMSRFFDPPLYKL
jgi:hypothetical protein